VIATNLLGAVIDVALSPAARAMAEASRLGRVVKCFAAYDRAIWRDGGFSGEAYHPRGTVRATVALESPDGGPAIVLAFIVGREAAAWAERPADQRRAAVIDTLVAQFGEPAAKPLDDVEVDWGADPWSAGCVAGLAPGVLGAGAAWREPCGRIHLAGTESAVAWPGYMEGAIEAGERAAVELLGAAR
jgi:monoamine oxidase